MPKTKQKTEYKHNIKPPKELWDAIQKLIDTEPDFYYRSPTEFFIESARLRLIEFEDKIQRKKEFGKRD